MTRTPEKLGSLRARTASRAWCPRTNSADGARRFANTAAANRAGPAETRATAAEEPPADENTPEAATRAARPTPRRTPRWCARGRGRAGRAGGGRNARRRGERRRRARRPRRPTARDVVEATPRGEGLIVAAVASGRATRVHVRAPRVHGRAPRVVGLDAATLASARRAVLGKGRGRGRGRGWGSGCVTDRGESGRSARLEGWRVVGGGGAHRGGTARARGRSGAHLSERAAAASLCEDVARFGAP